MLKALGKPTEVRRVQADHLLDGIHIEGGYLPLPDLGPETERWVYGTLGNGMFASVGYVSIDRKGRVVAAVPPDPFSRPGMKLPKLISATSDDATKTPAELICRLRPVEYVVGEGKTSDSLKTTVTLHNHGREEFRLRHDAASSIRRFLIVEVYDSKMTLLWRDYEMLYHSPVSSDPSRWPLHSIPPGESKSEDNVCFSPCTGFGRLPAGAYSLRVYFPFGGQFYPSNLVRFEVPARAKKAIADEA